jgi:transposase
MLSTTFLLAGATDMKILSWTRLFVGLDYHQDFVQVCVLDEAGKMVRNSRVENDWRKIVAVVPAGAVVQAALEACCGAASLADELAERAGWSVSLAHPGFVARMKQNPDKTDYSDARLLADLTRVGYLPKVWLAPAELRELRRLVRYRQQKANERRDVKLRIRAILRDHRIKIDVARPWTRQWLTVLAALKQIGADTEWILQEHLTSLMRLSREIRDVERRLEERVAGDAVVKKLREQKGIGLVTAATMRAEIGRFDRFQTVSNWRGSAA